MCAEDEGGMTECLRATGALSPYSIDLILLQEGQAHTVLYEWFPEAEKNPHMIVLLWNLLFFSFPKWI